MPRGLPFLVFGKTLPVAGKLLVPVGVGFLPRLRAQAGRALGRRTGRRPLCTPRGFPSPSPSCLVEATPLPSPWILSLAGGHAPDFKVSFPLQQVPSWALSAFWARFPSSWAGIPGGYTAVPGVPFVGISFQNWDCSWCLTTSSLKRNQSESHCVSRSHVAVSEDQVTVPRKFLSWFVTQWHSTSCHVDLIVMWV